MNLQELSLGFSEQVVYALRGLYSGAGYGQYKMSKFEDYDLYAGNKDFLISDSVITFMDLNGKLMALKPDVTLSIVKNTKDIPNTVQKLYYNENIYRVSKGSHCFREMMQVGLECIGEIDGYCISEVLSLAAESLACISENWALNISHLGVLTDLLDAVGLPQGQMTAALAAVGEKNFHALLDLCRNGGVSEEKAALLCEIVGICGAPETVLPEIIKRLPAGVSAEPFNKLLESVAAMEKKGRVRFDFSVIDDVHYYNGIVFKGFISGVPSSVLSGGQYDMLMKKMHRRSGAIGFAVYLDELERLEQVDEVYDVDAIVTYSADVPASVIASNAKKLRQQWGRVLVCQKAPENLRCRYRYEICNGEVKLLG